MAKVVALNSIIFDMVCREKSQSSWPAGCWWRGTHRKNHTPNTWRNNDVVITSKRRHCDVITSQWRRFDVITTSFLRNVSAGIHRTVPIQSVCWVLMIWHIFVQCISRVLQHNETQISQDAFHFYENILPRLSFMSLHTFYEKKWLSTHQNLLNDITKMFFCHDQNESLNYDWQNKYFSRQYLAFYLHSLIH